MSGKFKKVLDEKLYCKTFEKKLESNQYRGLFLDRDGVIIKDCHYIDNPLDVVLEKGARKLIIEAYKLNWRIIVVSNQSGISRGYFNWDDYDLITNKLISLFDGINPFTAIYANSLLNNNEIQSWRKPSPKMITYSAEKLNINLSNSILIGDRLSDIEAGIRAKVGSIFHVATGHGKIERENIYSFLKKVEHVCAEDYKPCCKFLNNLESFDYSNLKLRS